MQHMDTQRDELLRCRQTLRPPVELAQKLAQVLRLLGFAGGTNVQILTISEAQAAADAWRKVFDSGILKGVLVAAVAAGGWQVGWYKSTNTDTAASTKSTSTDTTGRR